ncbi:hypothetical protein [Pedobacter psychroterrae]|uniref:Lipoprotein n=1 Tax=Pedobacter psychroterrae TaxID=2530453 RepID=A0A4R0NH85_9SPHI|nr:hypothetical protein [Pedobacter psychroterrae]TCC99931.1 hypothetical protein EZ437_16975 [Pedobacter psychroterrae]
MNIYTRIIFSIISLLIIISLGCRREDPCQFVDPESAYDSFIILEFFSKETGKPLLVDTSKVYSLDNIKLFDDKENPLTYFVDDYSDASSNYLQYHTIAIRIHRGNEIMPMNQDLTKRFFLDLDKQRDTIDCSYKRIASICNGSTLEYLKVNYNGKPAAEEYNSVIAKIRIEK